MEYWKIVGSKKTFKISNYGNVKKLNNGKWVDYSPKFYKTDYTGAGYLSMFLNGKNRRVHRLVAENFIDNPENKREVDHIDGNRFNNNYKNLRWATRKENAQSAAERNVFKGFRGDGDIDFLVESTLLLSGYKIIEISNKLKKDRASISKMFNSDNASNAKGFKIKLFNCLFGELMLKTKNKYHKRTLSNRKGSHKRKLTDEQIDEIKNRGDMIKDLASEFGVSRRTIYRHKNSK